MLKDILELEISCCPKLLLLNDDSLFNSEKPHSLAWTHWMHCLLDIVNMELSVARLHGASQRTISSWSGVI